MSFLGSIVSYIEEKVGIVEPTGTDAAKKSAPKNEVVVKVKPGEVGDITKYSGKTKPAEASAKSLKAAIDTACDKNGINKEELYKILLTSLGFKTIDEFYTKLSKKQQEFYLGLINASVKRAEKHSAKQNKCINVTNAVAADTKLTFEAVKNKTFEKPEDIAKLDNNKKFNKTYKKLLGNKNINSLSEEEWNKAIADFENEIANYYTEQKTEIDKIKNPQERAKALEKLNNQIAYKRDQIYNEILMAADSEHAVEAITIVAAKRLPHASKRLYTTRRDKVERTRTANMFTHQRVQEKVVKTYYQKGDKLSAETFKEFTSENISYMSTGARETYQNDYVAAREKYEAEGYPEYMSREMYQAEAAGIVIGTQNNENMTAEEKSSAIENFYEIEKQKFNDVDKIQESVNTYIENQKSEKDETYTTQTYDGSFAVQQQESPKNYFNYRLNFQPIEKFEHNYVSKGIQEQISFSYKMIKPVDKLTTIVEVTNALYTRPFEQVKKDYPIKDIAKAVFANSNLKTHLPRLKWYICSLCPEELRSLTFNCSEEAYFFVLRNVTPDKASKLHDSRNNMCYAERKLGDEICESRKEQNELNS